MQVGVAYAEFDQQVWLKLEVPNDSTLLDAVKQSGILTRFPHIDLSQQKVGIFGRFCCRSSTSLCVHCALGVRISKSTAERTEQKHHGEAIGVYITDVSTCWLLKEVQLRKLLRRFVQRYCTEGS